MAIHPQVRVFVRPYGSAVPLGFFAFGIGMFLYAAFDAEWIKATDGRTVGLIFVAFVGPLEALAASIAFLARDTMAGVALGLFTGSWFLTGFATMKAQPGVLDAAQGYLLVAFTIAVLLLSVVAWLGQPLIAGLLTVAAARGACSAAYQLGAGKGWNLVWAGRCCRSAAGDRRPRRSRATSRPSSQGSPTSRVCASTSRGRVKS
jgi:hypothetical protein